ncbi:YphA family membrane protein [Virgibacillus sp. DJP39]|uniref:YphA family membrane protein n=1 Tax=Virgibacillus sp. DJP39 TaxID=3409790 RepID=UPI003BB601D3
MTNGLLFYWLSWLLWIYITFLMKKGKSRTLLGLWILLIIAFSDVYLTIMGFKFTISFVLLALGAMFMFSKSSYLYYHLFCSLTIMVLYLTIRLWENYFPLWVMISKTFVSPFIIVLIVILIIPKGFYDRVYTALLGVSGGELVYSFILSSYSINESIGGYVFFDCIMVILFSLIGIEGFQALWIKIKSLLGILKKSFRVITED